MVVGAVATANAAGANSSNAGPATADVIRAALDEKLAGLPGLIGAQGCNSIGKT